MRFSIWLVALAAGGAMIGAGIAYHPALIIGGALVVGPALVKWLQESLGA